MKKGLLILLTLLVAALSFAAAEEATTVLPQDAPVTAAENEFLSEQVEGLHANIQRAADSPAWFSDSFPKTKQVGE